MIRIQAPLESVLAGISLLVSLLATVLVNHSNWVKEWSLNRAWHRNDMDALCKEAIAGTKPVAVTLDTRKVYVGLVFDSLEPGKEANLTILPLYSGYRDKDTLEMHLTRKYTSVDLQLGILANDADGADADDAAEQLAEYRIVIPRERIVTLHIALNSLRNSISSAANNF